MTALNGLTWQQAFSVSVALVGIGNALHAAQLLAIRGEFGEGGLLNWSVLRMRHPAVLRSPLHAIVDRVLSPPTYVVLLAVQVGAALLVVLSPSQPPASALAFLLGMRILYNFRNEQTIIGADQMQVILLAACLMYTIAPTPAVQKASAWFVCLQLILGYVAAGLWKLSGAEWRSGAAVRAVMRTRTMGERRLYHAFSRFPTTAAAACWGTILFECGFPWLLFGGVAPAIVFLAAGLTFHVGIAIAMGFDEFLWAYVGAYPIALGCAVDFQRVWQV